MSGRIIKTNFNVHEDPWHKWKVNIFVRRSTLVWFFYRSEISESNLPKWIGISSLSIQIVSQNIVNSRIAAHNKNKLKFHENCGYTGNASSKNYF